MKGKRLRFRKSRGLLQHVKDFEGGGELKK